MAENPNFIQRLFGRGKDEKRYSGNILPFLSNRIPVYSSEGITTGQDSLQLSTVYAAVSRIADTIASMEPQVISLDKEGTPEVLKGHPVAGRISREPNPHMGAYEFWQLIISDALLYGVGHAHVLQNGEVYHIPAPRVSWTIDQATGQKFYKYDGAPTPVPQANWLEIKAFRGLNPTLVQYQNLSTQKSIQDFGDSFFKNGGMLGGILSTKEYLDAEQMQAASDQWEREYTGSQNAHKVALLGGGFTYQPLSVPLDQLQWAESRKYGAEEIARIFSVPPAMLGMDSQTAYSNYEQQVLQFFQGCIFPWVRRIESEIERKMLKDVNLECRFNVDALLRADLKNRSDYYHTLLSDGVMSINEVRAKEGLGPVDGGDEHHLQVNQLPLSSMKDYANSITGNNGEDVQQLPEGGEEPSEGGTEAQGED